jgi:subtilisin family serine protease
MATDYRIVAKGINYAVENGAKVINLSLGGQRVPESELRDAIIRAYEKDILIVGSAGNQNNSIPHYPDAYPEVISVAAVDAMGRKMSYSNYGPKVEVCAVTDNMTTLLGGGYGFGGGTSHSTPCVAALGALLFSRFPNLSNSNVRQIITSTADSINYLNGEYSSMLGSGKINFRRALEAGE